MDAKLVEKVARAIAGEMNSSGPIASRKVAQAAIAAVLEHLSAVTPEMVEAGKEAFLQAALSGNGAFEAAYLAMLRAAPLGLAVREAIMQEEG